MNLQCNIVMHDADLHCDSLSLSECHLFFYKSTHRNYTHEPKLESTLLHTKIVDVACGQNYTLALDEEAECTAWARVRRASSVWHQQCPAPSHIPEEERVVKMSYGWSHVACLTELKE